MPRDQFNVQGGGNQLVIVACISLGHLPQPIARCATRPDANHYKTGQTTEYLSTGKGHGLNYLTYQQQAWARKRRIRYTRS
jgi:hypothetical protein